MINKDTLRVRLFVHVQQRKDDVTVTMAIGGIYCNEKEKVQLFEVNCGRFFTIWRGLQSCAFAGKQTLASIKQRGKTCWDNVKKKIRKVVACPVMTRDRVQR